MFNVYCIPGMGVNERLFRNLKIDNCRVHHIKWKTPLKNESLPDYAMRLAEQIDTNIPFVLVGVSFGGMCSVEIAKHLKPAKTFIVSSIKFHHELPLKIKFWRVLPIYRMFRDGFYKNAVMLAKRQFGVISKEQQANFRKMLDDAPVDYFSRAVHCLIRWRNLDLPENVVHIHGTADRVLPHRNLKSCDHLIKGGSHFMIINKADEISGIINKELKAIS